MKRPKLEIPYLDLLPQPPEIVKEQLDNWKAYQYFLSKGGPRQRTSCGSIEHMYVHYSRSRGFNQWGHAMEPNPRDMYDKKQGEQMDGHIMSLSKIRRLIVVDVWWRNMLVRQILKERRISEDKFHQELRSAYNQLAGKLCPSK